MPFVAALQPKYIKIESPAQISPALITAIPEGRLPPKTNKTPEAKPPNEQPTNEAKTAQREIMITHSKMYTESITANKAAASENHMGKPSIISIMLIIFVFLLDGFSIIMFYIITYTR